jgi:hypothetical protein
MILIALFSASAAPVCAQDSVAPPKNARVRAYVVPPGAWRVGALVRLTGDTLFLRPERCRMCAPEAIPRESMTRLEVSGAGGHPLRGMAVGLVAGALVGGALPCRGSHGGEGPPCGLAQANGAAWGAIVGALVGGIVGSYLPPRERWWPVVRS